MSLDVGLTAEQHEFRQLVERFVQESCTLEVERYFDQHAEFPVELFNKMAKLDLTGLIIPTEWEGLGLGAIEVVAVHEALAYGSVIAASALFPTSLGTQLLLHAGSKEQKDAFLPRLARGEVRMSFALTEPKSGSDAASLTTRATRQKNGGWTIEGHKTFISGAHVADYLMIAVRTDSESRGGRGISVAIARGDSPGISISPIETLGPKFQLACDVFLDGVEVGEDDILGGEAGLNDGWNALRSSLDLERLIMAAQAVGLASRALDDAKEFVMSREAFGQPIGHFQAIQHLIADLATGIEAGRALTYGAAKMVAAGLDCSREVSMAKLFTTEHSRRVCLEAVQLCGGYGYTMEFSVQRYLRRSLVGTIGGGTSQIQRNIIARALGM